jgi:hypothetical protein
MVQSEGAETSRGARQRAGTNRLSRRQVMGRAGAVATATAVAWVVPEILVAQPGSAAGLSGNPGGNGNAGVGASTSVSASGGGASAGAGVSTSDAASASRTGTGTAAADPGVHARTDVTGGADVDGAGGPSPSSTRTRAATGLDMKHDGEIGAALMASGWALHHWTPNRG